MASTFRRRKTGSDDDDSAGATTNNKTPHRLLGGPKGTKPWTGGITLTSTGLRDLDQLLLMAGGQPLGTCIWLEEDRWTRNLAQCLIKYWCAEVGRLCACTVYQVDLCLAGWLIMDLSGLAHRSFLCLFVNTSCVIVYCHHTFTYI